MMTDTTLDFHDSSQRSETASIDSNQSPTFRLDGPEGLREDTSSKSFWSFEYYQQFFDVNTDQVKNRIIWGMIPRPGVNYIHSCIKPNPDLYGPFWICVTLIFTIAICSNLSNYLQFAPDITKWKYDFHIVSYAATAIFCYAWLVPLALWSFIKWNSSSQAYITFLELLCVYGYSLGIYIPVAMLWLTPNEIFHWVLLLLAAALSGFVLLTTLSPALEGSKKYLVLTVVISLHFILPYGLLVLFFPKFGKKEVTSV